MLAFKIVISCHFKNYLIKIKKHVVSANFRLDILRYFNRLSKDIISYIIFNINEQACNCFLK